MKNLPTSFVAIAVLLIIFTHACNKFDRTDYREMDFNSGWKFTIDNPAGVTEPGFDDQHWTSVHLPHDWSIQDYAIQDSLHTGPFYKYQPGGVDIGYLRTGIAWYRKLWKTPKKLKDQQVILNFDGVQTQMELWVNGKIAAGHVYGYSPFKIDITQYLNKPGRNNVIAVKTVNSGENSRWFAGAGIYRSVSISVLGPLHIAPRGVHITTPLSDNNETGVNFNILVKNTSVNDKEARCVIEITGPDDKNFEFQSTGFKINAKGSKTIKLNERITDPLLWSPDSPSLYRAKIRILEDGSPVDVYTAVFGIRTIDYSAEKGFLLNGKQILMKGACLHHDNGLLGAAAFRDAEYRKVRIMKENGYNAIRTSHNPPSSHFLNACDSIGMLVINEAFDHWVIPKRKNDYSNYFREWYKKDIQAMVYRDRNHPSVIMWSIGNEVKERADSIGIKIGKDLVNAIREADDTRPVTQAICGFWDNPGKVWDDSEPAFEIVDIGGYNYQHENFEADHIKYPDRIMYGSESTPKNAYRNWRYVEELPYVIGDFVWTGMDYIGESGIGHHKYSADPEDETSGLKSWPWYNAWCGDIDLIGNKKPQSYYRDVVWGQSNLEVEVAAPTPKNKHEITSFWGWPEEQKSWNWKEHENKILTVRVYTTYPIIRLTLNGKTVAEETAENNNSIVTEFQVKYEPGRLICMGLDNNGNILESKSLRTSGDMININLTLESNRIKAHRNSLVFINVDARDGKGIIVPDSEHELLVKVKGAAELLSAGNASPKIQGSFTDNHFRLFRGKGLIILRSTGQKGSISVEVSDRERSWETSIEAI
ncbi:MAG: DUF4982 domain-containing protein [Bacteroidales bacterium]|nr:DUF4982 domain-containing protein [Bacteroidales bacterium]